MLSSTHQWSGALIADPVNAGSQLEGSSRQLERGSTNSARIAHGPVLESNEEEEEPMEEAEPTEPIWLRLDDILTTAQTSHSGSTFYT